ncbi:MAG TPA: hypothetical protein VGT61_12705 [Thermomicrobiales bacterium]|jgi:hypothetical protein|nr:hypothetical protein [Thermomicrobiales bacterium]
MYRTDLELTEMITDRRQSLHAAWRPGTIVRNRVPRPGRVRRALGRRIVSLGLALVG